MRFGVLGPLMVWGEGGEAVRVPEAKVRLLLGALLVARGRPVSAETLIDDLWGGSPPGSAANTLQGKVSLLRKALGSAGGVERQAAGYSLRVAEDEVDAWRFEALLARARASADPEERERLLTEALSLWRGAALADFAEHEFARPHIARLEELRLVAVEERAAVRLARGEHDVLAAELAPLAEAYPLRERLRAVQIEALYRSGRQGEALAAYHELRTRLADELGVDPSPELAALHAAMVRQDPALGGARSNLPVPLTPLVGREEAVAAVRRALGAGRLVTLTGTGGVGKTRLAVETAAGLAPAYPDGVWLVELAGIRDGDAVISPAEALVAVLGLREGVDRIAEALRGRRTLVVFDNCEHVIEQVAELAGRLLGAVPGLSVLATSQEPLGVAGETVYPVPPLEPEHAARLFEERAAASSPGVSFGDDERAAVAEICRRLDGIPLALELAATRVRVLGVRELAARLDDRFALLAGGARGVPARQRTLRAMIDWSWELLTEPERVVLRRLAVHADGCSLAAAEAVCAGGGLHPGQVLDLLARLVDRSLVVVGPGPRYRLLESVAAYCAVRLREAGEDAEVRERHAEYYTDLAERAGERLRGHDQREWLERLDLETPNLRSALETAVRARPDLAVRLSRALLWYQFLRGRLEEARRTLRAVLALGEGIGPAFAEAGAWLAGITLLQSEDPDPAGRSRAGLGPYERAGDPAGVARARWFHGYALYLAGELSVGEELAGAALAEFRAGGDAWGEAAALAVRAHQALSRGDLSAARVDAEAAAAAFAALGDRWGQTFCVSPRAALAEIDGDYDLAERLLREGLRSAEELGLRIDVSYRLSGLGRIALLRGDHEGARRLHERALRLATEQSHRAAQVFAEIGLALGARRAGDLDAAERHLRALQEWYGRVDVQPGNTLILAELGFVAELRGDPERALSLHLAAFSIARDVLGDPRAMALALEGSAAALAGTRAELAATLLGAACAARARAGHPLPPAERADVDRATALATERLGEPGFAAAFARGTALGLDEARALL
ncbi:BTAD domain-containing putative transcriptional regulator [Bailinhaonella thermotolerans]|uniref:AfsR/SARP family transcriptional regulator n=1 Tax=Bailinhaonella thermotolerans TaxID=1070861 RepID=A0A3A4ANS3_9ACTN|nr:BTAD domain-containing putative transcriptional regulator [Bailinhaonella thermotolerans]RJL30115.1 AfsR/SARP family transcriptional regulator [Bailinhaonella thermotolerans]